MADETPTPVPVDGSRTSRWLAALCLLCLVVAALTTVVARHRDCLDNPDEAAYAEQARAILGGRPLEAGFVRHFHVRYPQGVVHPEDFYPPGNGALLALAWTLVGPPDTETLLDWPSTVPSLLLACLVLPLLAFALTRRVGGSAAFAFVAGAVVLFDPQVRAHAYQGLADLPLCASALGATVAALGAGTRASVAAGALLGLGFWCKPAALLLVPAVAVVPLSTRRRGARRQTIDALALAAAFALVASPWLVRNALEFGDPLYSGNQHLTAAANDPSFRYEDIRKVYWAAPETAPPTLADSAGRFTGAAITRLLTHVWQCALVHGPELFDWLFVIAALALWRHRRARAMVAALVVYCLALSAVFAIEARYLMPVVPLAVVVMAVFGDSIVGRLAAAERWPRPHLRVGAIALVVAATATAVGVAGLGWDVLGGRRGFASSGDYDNRAAALWARDHLPGDAVVMHQEALRFRYYSGLRTVNTPFDRPDAIEAVLEAYRVTHIVQSPTGTFAHLANRALDAYLARHGERFRREDPAGQTFTLWLRR
jgi:hypothetical protein